MKTHWISMAAPFLLLFATPWAMAEGGYTLSQNCDPGTDRPNSSIDSLYIGGARFSAEELKSQGVEIVLTGDAVDLRDASGFTVRIGNAEAPDALACVMDSYADRPIHLDPTFLGLRTTYRMSDCSPATTDGMYGFDTRDDVQVSFKGATQSITLTTNGGSIYDSEDSCKEAYDAAKDPAAAQ